MTSQWNTFAAPAQFSANAGNTSNALDMTTFPLQFHVSQAVAGAGLTTCTGRFEIFGYYE